MFKKSFVYILLPLLFILFACNSNEEVTETENLNEEIFENTNEAEKADSVCSTIGEECNGGFLAYLDDEGGGLIAAPEDSTSEIQWGCREQKMDVTKDDYGTGFENTRNILNWHQGWEEPWFTGPDVGGYCHEKNDGTIAARICDELEVGEYTDWFLPSKEELNFLYKNLSREEHTGFTISEPRPEYWSSSEYTEGSSWVQDFKGGQNYGYQKTFNRNVRCVRYL